MAYVDFDTLWSSSNMESIHQSFNISIEEGNSTETFDFIGISNSSTTCDHDFPKPPTLPSKVYPKMENHRQRLVDSCNVSKETRDAWEELYKQGYGADVHIITDDGSIIAAHNIILSIVSPVLRDLIQKQKVKNGIRYLKIPGVPYDALSAFIRFLYSSCYEEDKMKKFVLHLLVLSHAYIIPSLKRVCVHFVEQGWLNNENVIDVLQLARNCDAPRLDLVCLRMVLRDFKSISSTQGWKVMKRANPALEQELLESVIEAETRKQERLKRIEERKVYLHLHEAMDALIHICRDGCKTIGPCDKVLKGSDALCGFKACRGLESLVRHFSSCKTRVPGGCMHCKRMWQLLELHSRMCNHPDYCKVPLCRHFKENMQRQSKDEAMWKLLVSKVIAAKNGVGPPFSSCQSN